jgi:S1-C subfamily serine protease
MCRRSHLAVLVGLAAVVLVGALAAEPPASDKKDPKAEALVLSDKARAAPSVAAILGRLKPAAFDVKDAQGADRTGAKGIGLKVYPKVAPAVVLVRSPTGTGTGFLIDPAGWVVTNYHVIADALPDTRRTGALQVKVYLGKLVGGQMDIIRQGVDAYVYKKAPVQDLALLKLAGKPEGVPELPSLSLSGEDIKPGMSCVAIGHPAAGALWTLRSGEVAAVSRWPQDRKDVVLGLLTLDREQDRRAAEQALDRIPPVRVVLSTCGVNPGDSGGPLVDEAGKLIAVTFARPRPREGVELNVFSYHVHRDELKVFLGDDLARLPATPPPDVPDALPSGVLAEARRVGGLGLLLFGEARGKPATGLLLDLKGSNPQLTPDELADPDKRAAWKYQFALHRTKPARAFYDSDGDGRIDKILIDVDGDGQADMSLGLEGGRWKFGTVGPAALIDPAHFGDRGLRERFAPLVPVFKDFVRQGGRP